jgi:CRISPR system Cascade subunit CasE
MSAQVKSETPIMFLSNVRLNRNNRHPKLMIDLSNHYSLHQRISFAFGGETGEARPLWRLEEGPTGPRMLVQSKSQPDWQRAFSDVPGLLAGSETKPYDPRMQPGQVLRFLLRANPTRKPSGTDQRVGILDEIGQQLWLRRQGERSGFDVLAVRMLRQGNLIAYKPGAGRLTIFAVDFEGLLRISDKEAFQRTIEHGVGHSRFLGCGLLSLART